MTQHFLSVVLQRVLHFYSFLPQRHSRRNKPLKRRADARAWILMDYASGKVLAEGSVWMRNWIPASLTKYDQLWLQQALKG